MSWIHLADVIDLFVASARQEGFRGVVNGVAPSPLRNSDFTRELGRALRRPAVLPAPEFALRLALGEMATLLLGSQRVASTARAKLGLDYRFPELRFALDDLLSDFAHEVECEQWLPRSPEEVFPFFSEPFNLERITPDFLGFQVVGISTDKLQEGTRIEYKLRIRGIPVRWQSAIERWSPNRCFVDRQIKGPYKSWHHTHEFEAHAGGTVVRDRIRYEVPLGAVGALMGDRWVARDVARIFEYRRERLRAIFG
jgi:ligand-binding SRPBCC domain-containing protein